MAACAPPPPPNGNGPNPYEFRLEMKKRACLSEVVEWDVDDSRESAKLAKMAKARRSLFPRSLNSPLSDTEEFRLDFANLQPFGLQSGIAWPKYAEGSERKRSTSTSKALQNLKAHVASQKGAGICSNQEIGVPTRSQAKSIYLPEYFENKAAGKFRNLPDEENEKWVPFDDMCCNEMAAPHPPKKRKIDENKSQNIQKKLGLGQVHQACTSATDVSTSEDSEEDECNWLCDSTSPGAVFVTYQKPEFGNENDLCFLTDDDDVEDQEEFIMYDAGVPFLMDELERDEQSDASLEL